MTSSDVKPTTETDSVLLFITPEAMRMVQHGMMDPHYWEYVKQKVQIEPKSREAQVLQGIVVLQNLQE